MPRHPAFSPAIEGMRGDVYSALAHRLATLPGEVYPLHVGDTWMEPPEGCRMEDLRVADHPGMHRYAPVQGTRELIDVIVERVRVRTGTPTERSQVLVAAGATGGLAAVVGGILAPGEEVLILAPYWPLISGIVTSFNGRPVPVPILEVDGPEALVEALTARTTERTTAVYLNTPNNPSGRVLPRSWVEAVAEFAKRHDLWILADDVYEDYVYEGKHAYTRPLAPERTFSLHSFSKAFGMAGNRCGFVVGPAVGISQARKVSTHTFYSTPTAAQIAARRALEGRGESWAAEAARQYQATGREAARRLGVPAPQGGTFFFLDVEKALDERKLEGFLERCVEKGLLVAPGPSFGPFPHHVRLCFTCVPPEVALRGVERLAEVMGELPQRSL